MLVNFHEHLHTTHPILSNTFVQFNYYIEKANFSMEMKFLERLLYIIFYNAGIYSFIGNTDFIHWYEPTSPSHIEKSSDTGRIVNDVTSIGFGTSKKHKALI